MISDLSHQDWRPKEEPRAGILTDLSGIDSPQQPQCSNGGFYIHFLLQTGKGFAADGSKISSPVPVTLGGGTHRSQNTRSLLTNCTFDEA